MAKLTGIIFTAVILALSFNAIYAQNNNSANNTKNSVTTQTFKGPNFVDKNNDGVCDNRNSVTNRRGVNYIDKNNDGVCDNYGTRQYANGNGKKKGNGKCNGKGKGKGNGNGNGNGKGRGR